MNNAGRSLGASALLVALTVVAYLPALRGGFVWDDNFDVTENQALRSLEGLGKIWTQPGMKQHQYYPLAFTGFWLQYHLWNLQPFGYHLVNLLLHALNAVLLWVVLRRLEIPGSWWGAAIFALHPVQVESVAWVAEFKNVSSATFSLLALLAFLRFRPLSASGTSASPEWRFYALATWLFVCALLCKTAVCCLPVVVAVLLWWKLDRLVKRDVLVLVPWFVASLMLGLVTVRVESRLPEASPTGLVPSIVQRGLLAGRAVWFYASKVVWPYPLATIYPRWRIDGAAAGQYLFPVGALAVLIALWLLRRRIGKGPLAGVLCFAAMLLPVLGFFDICFFRFSYVADHFQYLACIGLIALAASVGATWAQRAGPRGRNLGIVAGAALLLTLGVTTWGQAYIYQDRETLWRDTLTVNPSAWIAHSNLGSVLCERGQALEAIEHCEQALRLKPNCIEAHNNLGIALSLMGRVEEAIGHHEQALRIDPDDADGHYNLGRALARLGRMQEAIGQYEQALRIKPDDADSHYNLGNILLALDKRPEAIRHYEQALRIKPDFVAAHYNLAVALELEGKVEAAIEHYKQALRLKPDFADAQNRLARLRPGR